jgi:hypothetical protein
MTTARRKSLLRVVAMNAAKALSDLGSLDRADLLEGISLILPNGEEAKQAEFTAFAIRRAEEAQLNFLGVLKTSRADEDGRDGHSQ